MCVERADAEGSDCARLGVASVGGATRFESRCVSPSPAGQPIYLCMLRRDTSTQSPEASVCWMLLLGGTPLGDIAQALCKPLSPTWQGCSVSACPWECPAHSAGQRSSDAHLHDPQDFGKCAMLEPIGGGSSRPLAKADPCQSPLMARGRRCVGGGGWQHARASLLATGHGERADSSASGDNGSLGISEGRPTILHFATRDDCPPCALRARAAQRATVPEVATNSYERSAPIVVIARECRLSAIRLSNCPTLSSPAPGQGVTLKLSTRAGSRGQE